jgi:hypothetical protein
VGPPAWRRERGRREKEEKQEQECFGLPHGGAIAGLVFGAIIIIVGLIWALEEWNVIEQIEEGLILPFVVVAFGILVLAGAIYGLSRRS